MALSKQEELVDRYVKEGNKDKAVKLIFELIMKSVEEKDFVKGVALRDKLYEVDPMALTEIVKAGEILEEARSKSIDQDHMRVWSDLYAMLSTEETNALYYAMAEATYDVNQCVFKQRDLDTKLYFIDSGKLKLTFSQDDKETEIDTLGQGDVVGEETFFSNVLCTTTLTAVSPVRLHFLDKDTPLRWENDFPGLSRKLHEFCLKKRSVSKLLREKGLDRRYEERSRLSGKGIFQLLDASGKPLGKAFKGRLLDISHHGISFSINIVRRDMAQKLLGRKLSLQFALPVGDSTEPISTSGTIVAVRSHAFDDHSVHVDFDVPMNLEAVGD